VSDSTKLRISLSHGGSKVFVYNADTFELLASRPSAESAGKSLGISPDTVLKCLKRGTSYGKYLFISSPIS
jgi:hypothetical protein